MENVTGGSDTKVKAHLGMEEDHFDSKSFSGRILKLKQTNLQQVNLHCGNLDALSLLLTSLPELRVLRLQFDCQELYREYRSRSRISGGQVSACPLRDLKVVITKLSKLELDVTTDSLYFERKENIPFPWKKIFESVPALKSFRVNCSGGNDSHCDTVSTEILESVCNVRKEKEGNPSFLGLEELYICGTPLSEHLSGLILEGRFPLQALSINLKSDDKDNPKTISELLEAHAESLQIFNCHMYSKFGDRHHPSSLPSEVKLPKLKELVLTGDSFWGFHLLSFLDVPILEKLGISSEYFSVERDEQLKRDVLGNFLEGDEFMESCNFPNLKEFLCDAPVVFRETELQILGKSMPALTDLRIRLGKETFPIVCELWRGLQSLHLVATKETYSLLDDCAITGIPVEGQHLGYKVQLEPRSPNITNLKNLRKFVLETKTDNVRNRNLPRPQKAHLSDVSANYGFLQLPKLQILRIETVCKFSRDIMVALENHVSELQIREPDIFQKGRKEGSLAIMPLRPFAGRSRGYDDIDSD